MPILLIFVKYHSDYTIITFQQVKYKSAEVSLSTKYNELLNLFISSDNRTIIFSADGILKILFIIRFISNNENVAAFVTIRNNSVFQGLIYQACIQTMKILIKC